MTRPGPLQPTRAHVVSMWPAQPSLLHVWGVHPSCSATRPSARSPRGVGTAPVIHTAGRAATKPSPSSGCLQACGGGWWPPWVLPATPTPVLVGEAVHSLRGKVSHPPWRTPHGTHATTRPRCHQPQHHRAKGQLPPVQLPRGSPRSNPWAPQGGQTTHPHPQHARLRKGRAGGQLPGSTLIDLLQVGRQHLPALRPLIGQPQSQSQSQSQLQTVTVTVTVADSVTATCSIGGHANLEVGGPVEG
jgi:hypothetical protein